MSNAPRVSVAFDVAAFTRGMDVAEDAIVQGAIAGLDRVANDALQIKLMKINRTYARPIPTSSAGRPKWTRKGSAGGWITGQQVVKTGEFERQVKTVGVQAADPISNYPEGYEQRLGVLPVSADNVDRRNPAAVDAAAVVRLRYVAMMQDTINEYLLKVGGRKVKRKK